MSAIRRPRSLTRCDAVHKTKTPGMIPGLQVCRNYRLEILRNAAFSEDLALIGLAQHVAAAPDGLDVVLAARRHRKLLAQLADEDVDDLELGLVHAAVEMIEEHLLGKGGALAEREELQRLVFFAGQMHASRLHFDGLGVEVDREIAGLDARLRMALGATRDGVDA